MKTALFVIDMQNDYLYEKRKDRFSYDTKQLVASVNEAIRQHRDNGDDVIYIRHIIQDLPTNRLLFGYSIANSEGAELFDGLDVVSNYQFDKLVGDALSNAELRALVEKRGYDVVHLCGLDECGCVASTALGAAKRGLKAQIIRSATATVFSQTKVAKTHAKLSKANIEYI